MRLADHETQEQYYKMLKRSVTTTDIEGIAVSYNRLRFLMGESRAAELASLVRANKYGAYELGLAERIPNSYTAFCLITTSKNPIRLWTAINRNNALLRIRKQQEDAPAQGAESNLSGAC
ncbi:conserved hypothetical protein [Vibrio crassostreae]|nr:conserved hypothetical protein [Vibrio crassostreae]CAK2489499.1 conserved hypothetical protein [Vibrio crassostreae]